MQYFSELCMLVKVALQPFVFLIDTKRSFIQVRYNIGIVQIV